MAFVFEKSGIYNNLSDSLKKKLSDRIKSYGSRVRYSFAFTKKSNPDPEKTGGMFIYPNMYSLSPRKFVIYDNDDKNGGNKTIALVNLDSLDNNGNPTKFGRVIVRREDSGVLELNLNKPDDMAIAMFLELHPKNKTGLFPTDAGLIEVIDEKKLAKGKREVNKVRIKAEYKAQEMSDKEAMAYAKAYGHKTGDMDILRAEIEGFAASDPETFLKRIASKPTIDLAALVSDLESARKLVYNPSTNEYAFDGGEVLVLLPTDTRKGHRQKLVEFLTSPTEEAKTALRKVEALKE